MVDLTQLGDRLVGQVQLGKCTDQRFCAFTPLGGEALCAAIGLEPSLRAEEVTVAQFVRMAEKMDA